MIPAVALAVWFAAEPQPAAKPWRDARERFDLILMDVQMPDMDGLEATHAIHERERANGGRIPILAMTAHAMKGDRERCLAAGMDGYVSKPVRPRGLAKAIEQVMEQPASAR